MQAPEGRDRRVCETGPSEIGRPSRVGLPESHGRELRMSSICTLGWIWMDPEVRGVRQAERRAHADSRGIVRRAHAAGNSMPRQAWSGGL